MYLTVHLYQYFPPKMKQGGGGIMLSPSAGAGKLVKLMGGWMELNEGQSWKKSCLAAKDWVYLITGPGP